MSKERVANVADSTIQTDTMGGGKPAIIAQADEGTMPGATPGEKTARVLSLLGGLDEIVRPGDRVLLKPNFVAPFPQAATDLHIVEAVVETVRAHGGEPFVAESSGFEFDTAATFDLLGATEWAARHDVPLVNLDRGPFARVPAGGAPYGELEIAQAALDADVVINLPKLKRHNVTRVTLGIKNLMGLLSRESRRLMHACGVERGIADLARAVRPQLTILDALTATTRAVYGETTALGMVVGSRNVVALDRYGSLLLGVNPEQVPHIREAARRDEAGPYRVIGGREVPVPSRARRERWKGRLYRAIFQALYMADVPFSRCVPGRSLVPAAHYWLSFRPHIEGNICDRCGVCAEECPMDAIDLEHARIVAARCMRLRCLRCLDVCPRQAIVLHGWRRPSGYGV